LFAAISKGGASERGVNDENRGFFHFSSFALDISISSGPKKNSAGKAGSTIGECN